MVGQGRSQALRRSAYVEAIEHLGKAIGVAVGVKRIELAKLADETAELAAPAKPKPSPSASRGRTTPPSRQSQPKPRADKSAEDGKRKNQAPKEGKGAAIFAALKERWIPMPELLEFTGWLPRTLRGYISRTAKADGWTLERDKVDGVYIVHWIRAVGIGRDEVPHGVALQSDCLMVAAVRQIRRRANVLLRAIRLDDARTGEGAQVDLIG